MDFDFQAYIQSQAGKGEGARKSAFSDYAYGKDRKILSTLDRARFVKLALAGTQRLEKSFLKDIFSAGDLVKEATHPTLHGLAAEVARSLRVSPLPMVINDVVKKRAIWLIQGPDGPGIFLGRRTLLDLSEGSLRYGLAAMHGHAYNDHAHYLTTLFALDHMAEAFYGVVFKPARMALGSWLRTGVITADRAGLLGSTSLTAAVTGMLDIAQDRGVLEEPVDIDGYLACEGDRNETFLDFHRNHAHLALRMQALEAFSESDYYQRHLGKSGGDSLSTVDRRVEDITKGF